MSRLAQRIVQGDVPQALINRKVLFRPYLLSLCSAASPFVGIALNLTSSLCEVSAESRNRAANIPSLCAGSGLVHGLGHFILNGLSCSSSPLIWAH